MIGRFNPAGLLAGRPDVQKQAMMAQQQPETRQGLLGRTRGVIGGLLGGIQSAAERGSPEMNWADRAMIIGGGLRQIGGVDNALMDARGFVDQGIQGRQQQQAMQQQQEQLQQFIQEQGLTPEQAQMLMALPESERATVMRKMAEQSIVPGEGAAQYETIGPDHPLYPPGGRGMYQRNTRTGNITSVGNTAPVDDMGFGITVGPDGETTVFHGRGSQIPGALGSAAISGAQRREYDQTRERAQSTRDAIVEFDRTLDFFEQNPGTIGALPSAISSVTGALGQVQELFSQQPELQRLAQNAYSAANWESAAERDRFFGSENISVGQYLANTLAFAEARRRNPGARLTNAMVQSAKNNLAIGALNDTRQFVAVLRRMRDDAVSDLELANRDLRDLSERGAIQFNAPPPRQAAPPPAQQNVPPPPPGIDPNVWQFMTPEDRALWQQ